MKIINLAEWLRRAPKKLDHALLERMAVECECTPYEALGALFAGDDRGLGQAFRQLYCHQGKAGEGRPKKPVVKPRSHRVVKPHPSAHRRQFGRELERARLDLGLTKKGFGERLGLNAGYHMALLGRWLPTKDHRAYAELVKLGINPDHYRR